MIKSVRISISPRLFTLSVNELQKGNCIQPWDLCINYAFKPWKTSIIFVINQFGFVIMILGDFDVCCARITTRGKHVKTSSRETSLFVRLVVVKHALASVQRCPQCIQRCSQCKDALWCLILLYALSVELSLVQRCPQCIQSCSLCKDALWCLILLYALSVELSLVYRWPQC